MLDSEGDRKVLESDIVPYTDPSLRSRRARTHLAERLFLAGLLRPVSKVIGTVAPFTVVKKLLHDPPKTPRDIQQRMVLGQRREMFVGKSLLGRRWILRPCSLSWLFRR